MKFAPTKRNVLFISTVVIGVLFDQYSKYWAQSNLIKNEVVPIIDNLLSFKIMMNTGGALSFGSNHSPLIKGIYFQVIPALFLLYLIRFIYKNSDFSRLTTFGAGFAIAGGISNIIDRLSRSEVVDFILIEKGFLNAVVFNLADVFLIFGILITIIGIILNWKKI